MGEESDDIGCQDLRREGRCQRVIEAHMEESGHHKLLRMSDLGPRDRDQHLDHLVLPGSQDMMPGPGAVCAANTPTTVISKKRCKKNPIDDATFQQPTLPGQGIP